MSHGQFAKIYAGLWDGTLGGSWEAWTVFVYMLANCRADGTIDKTPDAITRGSCLPPEVVARGLEKLMAPDPASRSKDEGGARIVLLEPARGWGWRIVNYQKYRGGDSSEWSKTYRERNGEQIRIRDRERKRSVREASARVREASEIVREQAEAEAEAEAVLPLLLSEEGAPELLANSGSPPVKAPALEPLITNAGASWSPKPAMVEEWRRLFPAVNLEAQFARMRAWCLANERERKTAGGMNRFVHRWLAKEQDAARGSPPGQRGHRSGADLRYLKANNGGGGIG